MSTKERYQNPTCGDTVNLRLFVYNANNLSNVESVVQVQIFQVNDKERRLIETIDGSQVELLDTGSYMLPLTLTAPQYTIGNYHDVWTLQFVQDTTCGQGAVENHFQVYPNLWFTTPIPPVYDFNFTFRPNKVVKGSKRYLIINIIPNVPRGADIIPYYENLAIVSDLRVSISLNCGECVPKEKDLRLVVDRQLVDYREKGTAYFFLDTEDLDPGIYDVWFELCYGENVFVSEKNQLQIYE
jgi:hypothetical protein